jgi:hypothetical protein
VTVFEQSFNIFHSVCRVDVYKGSLCDNKSYFHSEVSKVCESHRNKEFLIPGSWDEELGEILVSPHLATLQWVTKTLTIDEVLSLLIWNKVTIDERLKSTYSFLVFQLSAQCT